MVIMGDDIGIMNVGAYHRSLMVGETPNIDPIASEGVPFTDAVAMQNCTSGRILNGALQRSVEAGLDGHQYEEEMECHLSLAEALSAELKEPVPCKSNSPPGNPIYS